MTSAAGYHYTEFLHPDDLLAAVELFKHVTRENGLVHNCLVRTRAKTGEVKWIQWNGRRAARDHPGESRRAGNSTGIP
jgi:hypothetical protein